MNENEKRLREALRAKAPYYQASDALRERVSSVEKFTPPHYSNPRRWTMFAGAMASVGALAFGLSVFFTTPSAQDRLMQDIISSHVRSIQVDHLTDVASSDQHTVKPWFSGKLDFSPPVIEQPGNNFALVGGRMDYIGQRNAAALIYKHNQHIINLTIWPEQGTNVNLHTSSDRGYHLVNWRQKGFTYWLVSDLDAMILREFAVALQNAS
jgi:anti-sigma factor RsiW